MTSAGVDLEFSVQFRDLVAFLDQQRVDATRQWFISLIRHDRWRTSQWVCRQINLWSVETMARGKTKAVATSAKKNNQWTTFVEISLAGHDLEAVNAEYGDPERLFDAVQEMVGGGYRVSLSYNEQNDAMIASATCKDDDSVNSGCTFTSFAQDWVTALRIMCYKHFVVTGQVWVGQGGTVSRPAFG